MSEQPGWQPAPPPPWRNRTALWVTIAVVVALLVGGGATALVLTTGVDRSGDDGAKPASTLDRAAAERDDVRGAAERGATVMNTLDYRDVAAGLTEWESVTTGDLLDEIRRGREETTTAIERAKTVTKAEVLTSAVSEVDGSAGTATVLVAVRVSVSTADAGESTKYQRLTVDLERTAEGWKTSGIGTVPVS